MNSTSLKKLSTCHPDLQLLLKTVDERYKIQVICGERNREDQNQAVKDGKSKAPYPNSKHNLNAAKRRFKSHAADIVPDPDGNAATLDWNDTDEFRTMLLVVEQVADELNIKIRLGRDFKSQKADLPHIELV